VRRLCYAIEASSRLCSDSKLTHNIMQTHCTSARLQDDFRIIPFNDGEDKTTASVQLALTPAQTSPNSSTSAQEPMIQLPSTTSRHVKTLCHFTFQQFQQKTKPIQHFPELSNSPARAVHIALTTHLKSYRPSETLFGSRAISIATLNRRFGANGKGCK